MHHDDVVGRDWPDVHGSSGCPGASLDGERVRKVKDGVDDDVGQDEGDQDGEADGSCQADVEVGQRLVPGAFDGHKEADGRDEEGEESAEVGGQDVRQEVDAANDSPELLDVDEAPDDVDDDRQNGADGGDESVDEGEEEDVGLEVEGSGHVREGCQVGHRT